MQVQTHTLKDGVQLMAFAGDHIGGVLHSTRTYYERDMLKYIREHVKHGTFIDVGANIGNHTLFFSKHCKADVIAFEPFQPSFNVLKENVQVNKAENCRLCRVALSDQLGSVTMLVHGQNLGMNKIVKKSAATDVTVVIETTTLDKFFADDIKTLRYPITLIKMDCEGHEPNALRGMIDTIDKYKPILFIECQDAVAKQSVEAIVVPLGYTAMKVFNATPTYMYVHSSTYKTKVNT